MSTGTEEPLPARSREVTCEPHDENHGQAMRVEAELLWRCTTCGREITDEYMARKGVQPGTPVVMT